MKAPYVSYALLILILPLLAACAGADARAQTATPTAGLSGDAGVGDTPGFEQVMYTLTTTGDHTQNVMGALPMAELPSGMGWLFGMQGAENTFQAIIRFPTEPAVGEFPVSTWGTGDYWVQITPTTLMTEIYDRSPSGTVTIESVNPLRGGFSFTVSNREGGTTTAAGTFEEAVYTYTVQATGATEFSMPPGSASMIAFPDGTYGIGFNTAESVGAQGLSVTINFPPSAVPGEYRLTPVTLGRDIPAGEATLVINTLAESTDYNAAIEGTLTLTEAGRRYSGRFTATATSADGATVTITGEFEGVPLLNVVPAG